MFSHHFARKSRIRDLYEKDSEKDKKISELESRINQLEEFIKSMMK